MVGLTIVLHFLPILAFVGCLIHLTGGSPVIVEDRVITKEGSMGCSLRFRTTGPGSEAFRVIGRFLRRWGIDELPGFWSVMMGKVRLRPVFESVTARRQ